MILVRKGTMMFNDDELLTVEEVAERLRVDGTTVRRWVKIGALPAVELPRTGRNRKIRIRSSTLEKLLQA
jgi:excisionase family DNA binding protein